MTKITMVWSWHFSRPKFLRLTDLSITRERRVLSNSQDHAVLGVARLCFQMLKTSLRSLSITPAGRNEYSYGKE